MDVEVSEKLLKEKTAGRYKSMYDWFVSREGQENEAVKLFDTTNEIIRRITRYAAQISEKNALGANRREEYRKVAEIFLKCEDIEEAHKMSAMVFGLERPYHLKGGTERESDSMNGGVYEESSSEFILKPRIRTYREKTNRSAIRELSEKKQQARLSFIQKQKEEMEKIRLLEKDGRIDFATLPTIEAGTREILLKWMSDALENSEMTARTEDGRTYVLERNPSVEKCVMHCDDGNMTMPGFVIVFQENDI
jgi:uncharacterized protein (TIGR02677 family)